jgi:hypothetical protein
VVGVRCKTDPRCTKEMERILRRLALVASLGAIALLWLMPMYAFQAVSETVDGEASTSAGTDTLIAVNGYAVLGVLAIPVLAALNAVLRWPARYRRAADVFGAVVTLAFCVLGALTVGLFFLPTATILLVLALWPRGQRPAT